MQHNHTIGCQIIHAEHGRFLRQRFKNTTRKSRNPPAGNTDWGRFRRKSQPHHPERPHEAPPVFTEHGLKPLVFANRMITACHSCAGQCGEGPKLWPARFGLWRTKYRPIAIKRSTSSTNVLWVTRTTWKVHLVCLVAPEWVLTHAKNCWAHFQLSICTCEFGFICQMVRAGGEQTSPEITQIWTSWSLPCTAQARCEQSGAELGC